MQMQLMQIDQAPVPPQFEGSPAPLIPCAVAVVATVPSWAAWCVQPPALPGAALAAARGKRSGDVRGCARRGAPQFSVAIESPLFWDQRNLSQQFQETMEGMP